MQTLWSQYHHPPLKAFSDKHKQQFSLSLPNLVVQLRSGCLRCGGLIRSTDSLSLFLSSAVHDFELSSDVTKLSGMCSLNISHGHAARHLIKLAIEEAPAQAHGVATSGLFGRHTELRLHMPPSIALATRGRLQGLRLQLALLDREFDDLDYDALRALDSDNPSTATSMSEEEINALPVHKYKVAATESSASSLLHASSSLAPAEAKKDSPMSEGSMKSLENELTCTICLEQVNQGELVCSLPCLHQFHTNCIYPWLRQQGTCPVCKFQMGSGWEESRESESDGSDVV
ncbi:zinc finger family protein [Tripterygium wilfordii]|uniref:RING-type E3 ubiquitin transferase n=1 Tax=Tripterygium wilfordii TaxID=458696 RepID=A0A7J7DYU5_TRIWF|nr:zinc finger family protein [Tripterygium wilfordii]